MGTWTQTKHRHAREVLARASAARQQWGQLARPFFRRPLSLATRVRVFQALVVSKMLYNVHTWAGVKPEEMEHWNNHLRGPIALLMKGVLAPQRKFRHPTDTLCAWCGMLPLPQQVHLNRLRFAKRLFHRCPTITWRLLNAHKGPNSWLAAFQDSCSWMQLHYDKPHLLPNSNCLQSWIQHICLDDHWKGRVRKTGRLALHYNTAQAEHAIWQHNFEATLQQAGATLPVDPVPFATNDRWQCDLCSKIFASTRALAMHASRDHGYRKKVRYFAVGTTCHVCGMMFHTRSRLAVHLEHNTKCYDVVQACWPPMPETEVAQLDQEDKLAEAALRKQGWWATKAFLPAVKTCGPSLPPEGDPASIQMFQKMLARRPTDAVAYHQLQGRRVAAAPATASGLWWQTSDLPAFVMHSPQGIDAGGGAFMVGGLAKEAARLHIRALVVVHFFSGFRRDRDIHQIVEQHSLAQATQLFVLSVDLCMQRQHADLATHKSLQWWKERAKSGQLVSIGGGPPCETYTAARQNDGLGPRPVRSATEPLGLPGLTWKEWQQIHIGDRLLRFILEMLLLMSILGYSGFIEHPQFPTWETNRSLTSIWCLKAIRLMKRLMCVSLVSFDQCVCGAAGRKPTTLLLVRLPTVRQRLLQLGNSGRCHHHAGAHQALIGKQEDGSFQTAKAKIYPALMNEIIGRAMHDFALGLKHPDVAAELPQEFEVYTVQQFMDHNIVQPDYHGI